MPYLLDTNVFIQAKNLYYGFDLCPGFWAWLIRANQRGIVYSIEMVLNELTQFGRVGEHSEADELAQWAIARGKDMFLPPNSETSSALSDIASWAVSASYDQTAIDEFFRAADQFLVAEGLARDYTVVTHEQSAPNSRKRIKIPDACAAQSPGVECISPFEMLRRENAVFVLASNTD